ncbi:hypothetical protein BJ875DRAFT_219027 [Amylocarpus encephaloides]|uniref:JmjC domain-containing protein n=1 Tax=Amylocarpus encephaloides TaxID=45428 RepID=A0A9P8C0I0_9HELO|nr:hypothetical protein BJ875DRAFT_219027 [Amylocarpus encephaloides]
MTWMRAVGISQPSMGQIYKCSTRLGKDPPFLELQQRFQMAADENEATHYERMAPLALHILGYGQPAQTSLDPDEADFLLFDSSGMDHHLQHGIQDKPVVFRDRQAFLQRPSISKMSMLRDLKDTGPILDVQDLGRATKIENLYQPAITLMPAEEVLSRFKYPTKHPINLLNLSVSVDGLVPQPIARHCTLLATTLDQAEIRARQIYDPRTSAIEKGLMTTPHPANFWNCSKWRIFGQAGAISGFHVDNNGVSTWVTLESNDTTVGEGLKRAIAPVDHICSLSDDESVLKLWVFIRLDNLPPDEQRKAIEGFICEGEIWMPEPRCIKILALIRGDTAMFPPNTIHAPITVTDSLFTGGMVMQG